MTSKCKWPIFFCEFIKVCLCHNLLTCVESAQLVISNEASDQINHPLWVVIKCPPSWAGRGVSCLGGSSSFDLTGTLLYQIGGQNVYSLFHVSNMKPTHSPTSSSNLIALIFLQDCTQKEKFYLLLSLGYHFKMQNMLSWFKCYILVVIEQLNLCLTCIIWMFLCSWKLSLGFVSNKEQAAFQREKNPRKHNQPSCL